MSRRGYATAPGPDPQAHYPEPSGAGDWGDWDDDPDNYHQSHLTDPDDPSNYMHSLYAPSGGTFFDNAWPNEPDTSDTADQNGDNPAI